MANRPKSAYVIVRMMTSIKQAVENAMAFAQETLGPQRTAFTRLEEIESTTVAGEDAWLITLSMLHPDEPPAGLTSMFVKGKREYKSFMVRKDDGQVTSMKIRELADA
ncbi:MAG: hypothetical protein WD696_06835 [Bryobacteraceae bacterium]